MHTTGWLTVRIQHLRSPDVHQRDEAARVIWDHFEARLRSLVRRRLDYRIRRREDEQDILQSMYASFCHGQLEGNPSPGSRHELWKLLARIARCKVVNTAKKHLAARRDVRRECTVGDRTDASSCFRRRALDPVDRAQPGPDARLSAFEEVEGLLQGLPDDLRRIVIWKLDGHTNAEIAVMLERTVRCVELKLQLIRKRLGTLPETDPAPV